MIDVSKHALPHLAKTNGSILTLSFIGSKKVIPEYGLMGPTKAALESTVKYLAFECGKDMVRVNSISPGPISTISSRAVPNFNELKRKFDAQVPLKTEANLRDDTANLATFLVSDMSTTITGQNLFVDKGFSIF